MDRHSNDERIRVLEEAFSRNVFERASSMSAKLAKSSCELGAQNEFIKFPFDSVLLESKVYRRVCESTWIREVSTALKDSNGSNTSGPISIMPVSSNSAIASEGDCASLSKGSSVQEPSDVQNLTTPEFPEDTYSSPGPPTLELSATDSSEQTGESSTTNPTTKSTLATTLSSIDRASAGRLIGRNGEDNPEHSSPTYVVSVVIEDIGTDYMELTVHEPSDHYSKTQETIHHIRDRVLLAGGVDPGSYCGVCVSSTIETRGQSELHRFPLTPEFLAYAVDKVRDGFYESFEILARFASPSQSGGTELSSTCSIASGPATKSITKSELLRPVDLLRKLISKRGKPRHSDIPSEAIAPFIESSEPEYRVKGGFSDVYKVKIHPTYLDWPADQDDQAKSFALKCFRRSDSAATMFRKELQALKAISSPGHPHLIELFGTYHWRGFDHLLFPWADGNLQDFWKSHPSPLSSEKQLQLDYSPTRRMLDQCLGLAEALDQIHLSLNPGRDATAEEAGTLVNNGRHGDIKPQNILWFREGLEERHVFKIADFGLAEVHTPMIDRIGPDIRGYTPTYGAPEFEHRSKGQRIDSSCDVWSFGCVLSEVATWMALGQEGLAAYRRSRYGRPPESLPITQNCALTSLRYKHARHGKFYEAEDGNVAISQPVLRQLKMLRQSIPGLLDPHLPEGLGPELDQFMDTTESCLAINGRERPSAAKVASMLQATPLAMSLSRSPEVS